MSMFVFVIVFGAILTMVEGAMHQNERVVDADLREPEGAAPC